MADWIGELNRILYERRHGLAFCDLPDEDQRELQRMRDMGFTAEEAFDVFEEVEDVE